jgi:arylsulfatase A-like enzyme
MDRIASEGAYFTDWYGQQSCSAGRAAFITGQSPIRTGLTKVGLPGTPEGMKKEDPTLATLLKAQGYITASSAKTTSVTATTCSRPPMASTSFSVTSTKPPPPPRRSTPPRTS